MRYVIYGAGAIGATIGGRLHQAGCDVTLIARGAHREALERDGLRLQTPDADDLLRIPVAEAPDGLDLGPEDVVVLAMKGQDAVPALDALAAAADPGVAVVCAQNGVENERAAARRFANSYGMLVYVPAQHLEPGVVQVFSAPRTACSTWGASRTAPTSAPSGSQPTSRMRASPRVPASGSCASST